MIIKKLKGFTLIELVLALGIGVMVSFIKFQDMKNEQDLMKASAAGEQIQRIGNAVNNYISLRYDKLSTLTSSTNQSSDPGPRTCSGSSCSITIQTLINDGILPSTYNDNNVFRSPYSIIIKRSGSSPNYVLDGLITTSAAWIEGSNIRYDLLGYAMQKAGIDSGVTKSNTSANGYNGNWSEVSSDFNNITRPGQLVFRAGYNASLYSAYLRRDGTLPMTGNLNMGGNDINSAKNITASGTGTFGVDLTAARTIAAGGEVYAHNGYGDTISMGGDNAGEDYEIRLSNGNRPLTIFSPNAANYTTVLSVFRNVNFHQRLGLMGYDPNDLPAGWGGGLRTLDVYAAGTVGTGSNGNINAYMNSSGNIYASNDVNVGHQVNTQYVWASGNLNSNYIHSNGNIDANGRLNAGEFVYINGQANVGWGCSPNGLIARTTEGRAVSCVNGAWQAVGGFSRSACYNVGNHDGRNFNAEYCNVGDYVAGLQFTGHRKSESTYEVICCKP